MMQHGFTQSLKLMDPETSRMAQSMNHLRIPQVIFRKVIFLKECLNVSIFKPYVRGFLSCKIWHNSLSYLYTDRCLTRCPSHSRCSSPWCLPSLDWLTAATEKLGLGEENEATPNSRAEEERKGRRASSVSPEREKERGESLRGRPTLGRGSSLSYALFFTLSQAITPRPQILAQMDYQTDYWLVVKCHVPLQSNGWRRWFPHRMISGSLRRNNSFRFFSVMFRKKGVVS